MDIDALRIGAAAFKEALQKHDRGALVAAARRLVELGAPLGQQWQGLAQEVFRWGEVELALKALDTWESQGQAGPYAAYQKATILARVGRAEDAACLMAALPAAAPTSVANAYLQGALATNLGEAKKAAQHFRRAVAASPDAGRAWLGLVQLDELTEADRRSFDAAAHEVARASVEDRSAYAAAQGLLAHRAGDHSAAFNHFGRAGAIERERNSYNGQDNRKSAAIAASWKASDIAAFTPGESDGGRTPIFVTGIARSGTTLVEQILAAHSAVDGGGELGLALPLEATIGGFAPADLARFRDRGGVLEELRDLYLRLVAERVPGNNRFVDKTLNLSRSLGPLCAFFPAAPVIWLKRNPLDNAFSIYRTWLANNVVGSWQLEDLADHMKVEDGLLAHWQRELGDRLLVVQYEDLVEDPRSWIDRISGHCGLESEERQYAFHRQDRAVTTASAMQVRQPVNRKGIGVAEPYRKFMTPFLDAYDG